MTDRDYVKEEWLAWQDVVEALAGLGINETQLNTEGDGLVSALRYWSWMDGKRREQINTRDHRGPTRIGPDGRTRI